MQITQLAARVDGFEDRVSAAPSAGTKMTLVSAPVCLTASTTVSKTGILTALPPGPSPSERLAAAVRGAAGDDLRAVRQALFGVE